MILSGKTIIETPRWLRGLVVLAAAIVLPLGFTLAQESGDDLEKARQWIESGVNSAFLTREQADVMLLALEFSNQQKITLIDPNGNVVPFYNAVEVVQSTSPEDMQRALAFARSHFEAKVASGQMSQSEAQAIVEDIGNAIDTGLAHGNAYYEQQFELGLIDQATAERRLRAIQEMEQAFNASPEGAALQSRSMPRAVVQAVPVDPSGTPANVARSTNVPLPVYRVERQPANAQPQSATGQ